ncbi:isoprenylcysteine carboxyl methyltransferase family protein [Oceanobacillus damuensis]|uniref:isoprenylcysteine carboxyl methyltransferase family protein n=1 Tax=Oceanobacillus damuensis TaxID=937928 RepID=UPI00082EB290|nr:isoprenylcysteine carboxylmethyltransferase family protein [Oceanobacillus damuensis]
MTLYMWVLFIIIIFQRLIELVIARRNEKWMKERGAIEREADHYKWFIIIHVLFFIFILTETFWRDNSTLPLNYTLLIFFILTQLGRVWCIASLGKFWNTKIIILPGEQLVSKGPYKYVKHPNYIIVGLELFIIPLLFGAIITAVIFPLLHILLLTVRIPAEERALNDVLSNSKREETGD